jgi:serine protease Do
MFNSNDLSDALAGVAGRIRRSLAVVHNGRRGAGAGVIWRADGLIVTNNHVIARGKPRVTLDDGREFPARILAQDAEIDLALLQIEAHDLPAAPVADSRGLRVGQMVMAIGHPWGQRACLTTGIVSGLSQVETRGKRGSTPVIRSDVRLAPGNSGGPLINASGGVIGINTMIVGGDISLAIPSQLVDQFVQQALGEPAGAPA